jgi:hypothetical protein
MLSRLDWRIFEVTKGVPAGKEAWLRPAPVGDEMGKRPPQVEDGLCAPTYEMHNFEPIPVGKTGFRPLVPRHDLSIQLYGNAVGLQPHFFN